MRGQTAIPTGMLGARLYSYFEEVGEYLAIIPEHNWEHHGYLNNHLKVQCMRDIPTSAAIFSLNGQIPWH